MIEIIGRYYQKLFQFAPDFSIMLGEDIQSLYEKMKILCKKVNIRNLIIDI